MMLFVLQARRTSSPNRSSASILPPSGLAPRLTFLRSFHVFLLFFHCVRVLLISVCGRIQGIQSKRDMKFGKHLREKILKEWRFYAVDYKLLKQTLKTNAEDAASSIVGEENHSPVTACGGADNSRTVLKEFDRQLLDSERKLAKFYHDKEQWAYEYLRTLEERVESLRSVSPGESPTVSAADSDSLPSDEDDATTLREGEDEGEELLSSNDSSRAGGVYANDNNDDDEPLDLSNLFLEPEFEHTFKALTKAQSFGTKQAWLKEEYRRMGASKHFKAFIYAKKSLATFERELALLLEFLDLNKTAFSKILKKLDKRMGSNARDQRMTEILASHPFLEGDVLRDLKKHVSHLIDEVHALKPQLPEGWENRKVYTIGCFDLFHRGHQNVLESLREFGYYVVAGIHDDRSYFQLKGKDPIDDLETRMANIKPFIDQIFVIPSTDPELYIQSMVSQQDIDAGSCCYARGDDMLEFPSREWVESVMPVHFVPRTEACSSTLIRTIYHTEDAELRRKAAFAKTRYDGKPIDEHGNLLKLAA